MPILVSVLCLMRYRHAWCDVDIPCWYSSRLAICAGTVLAATIEAEDGGGYASKGTAQIIASLREAGVFARPLGNVVYIMVTPTSSRATCAWLLQELNAAVQAAAPSKPGC